jgi:hypothetical protein
MAELKTKVTKASVTQFINAIEDDNRRKGCKELVEMMTRATKAKPVMWGPAIVGFGDHEYTGSSGKPQKWFQAGFSPRKAALTLYLMGGSDKDLLEKLGAHTMGASCLYIKDLDAVHRPTLQKLISASVKNLRKLTK